MSDNSDIEWTDDTKNLWRGCRKIDRACLNCYIERTVPFRKERMRFDKAGIGGRTGIVYAPESRLWELLKRRRDGSGRMMFINSLTDTWLVDVPLVQVARLWAAMLLSHWNIYQLLTKRASRQRVVLTSASFAVMVEQALDWIVANSPVKLRPEDVARARAYLARRPAGGHLPPPPNVWIGVTVGDNRGARQRIPQLKATPAAVRWLSCEPLCHELDDPLNLQPWLTPTPIAGTCIDIDGQPWHDTCANCARIDWAVFGGESGPAAVATDLDTEPAVGLRPISLDNLAALIGQCRVAGVAPYVKQLGSPWAAEVGAHQRQGRDPAEWPTELRIREYPRLVVEAVAA